MIFFGVLLSVFAVCLARPEPPTFGGYTATGHDYSSSFGGSGAGSFGSPAPQYGPPGGSAIGGSAVGGGVPAAPVVHKHVYVHIPPPEAPAYKPKKVYPQPVPQKHYKIVFIKAPTPPAPTVPDLPPLPPPDEQKTLIYVLVKKPEEQPEITIPTPAPTKPSKPEVYFIRYKTQKQEGSSGASAGGYPDSGVPSGSYSGSAPSGPSSSYGVPGSSSGGY